MTEGINSNIANKPANGYSVGEKMPDITGKLQNIVDNGNLSKLGNTIFCENASGKLVAVIHNETAESGGVMASIFESDKTYYVSDYNCDGAIDQVVITSQKGSAKYIADSDGNIATKKEM